MSRRRGSVSLAIAASIAASIAGGAIARAADAPLASGIDRGAADPAVRIQDDAFRAVNGHWLATTEIPADRASTGPFERLEDRMQPRLRALIDDAAANPGAGVDARDADDRRKMADLYASFVDEARVEAAGLEPARPYLARIDAIGDRPALARAFADLDRLGIAVPFTVTVHQDAKDSSRYVADVGQDGIGLPDRDYYLAAHDARFAAVRVAYRTFVARLLTMAGEPARDATRDAAAVVALEAAIARVQWDRVAGRDPVKTYNPFPIAELGRRIPHIDWTAWLAASGIAGRTDVLVVSQPSYLTGLDRLVAATPLATWRAYLKAHFLSNYAQYLDPRFVDLRFAFFGTVLHGAPLNRDRWKRGVQLVDESMGEALGRAYVARWFPPDSKARMDRLVANLLAAFAASIDGLDWMSDATKREARAKLAAFTPKVGYPKRWRDYSGLDVRADDLVGNVDRARSFEYRRNIAKLGQPVDRDEWGMYPQTINAYYNPEQNEIVFPAAILEPPFFQVAADDAVNYGAIGAMIGHEISHGFDDQGSQYDGQGNLRDWWTKDDRRRFDAKTKALVAQYDRFTVAGYHVNGALTLGENIADNAGLAIAAKAYRLSLGGKPSPVIDGLTGEQRLYIGFAQMWQEKNRDAAIIAQIKSDPHAPGECRTNGTLSNQPGFDDAFAVKPKDRMYRAPDQRVTIW